MRQLVFLFLLLLIFPSCFLFTDDELEKEVLFSLDYGRMDNEILYNTDNQDRQQFKIGMCSSDGLYYVSNGQARKVIEFNSYGEMLLFYYDETYNPAPIHISRDTGGETLNRRAYNRSFVAPGLIAVSDDKMLYIEDRVENTETEKIVEDGTILDFVIKKMDRFGNLVGIIGQDGMGGRPFPFIRDMVVSRSGDLVVVSRMPDVYTVHWFTSDLYPRYRIEFDISKWPGKNESVSADLDTFFFNFQSRKIMVKLDYYATRIFEDNAVRKDPGDYLYSIVWEYDPQNGGFDETNSFKLPDLFIQTGSGDTASITERKIAIPYTYLGINSENVTFFAGPMKSGLYSIIAVGPDGKTLRKGRMDLTDSDLVKSVFYVTEEGVLTGLMLSDQQVEIARWRTDWFVKTGLNGP